MTLLLYNHLPLNVRYGRVSFPVNGRTGTVRKGNMFSEITVKCSALSHVCTNTHVHLTKLLTEQLLVINIVRQNSKNIQSKQILWKSAYVHCHNCKHTVYWYAVATTILQLLKTVLRTTVHMHWYWTSAAKAIKHLTSCRFLQCFCSLHLQNYLKSISATCLLFLFINVFYIVIWNSVNLSSI